ncbi:hypothetical protein [Belnapia sp. F-4-1]|uniref:hypothetical protein n=1 Tax=Belnapia sp. F-4-1 TaxID=1545443 RepID=UPI0011870BC4|nr:hypothetical protein [Belnapia sp. F-4-1]
MPTAVGWDRGACASAEEGVGGHCPGTGNIVARKRQRRTPRNFALCIRQALRPPVTAFTLSKRLAVTTGSGGGGSLPGQGIASMVGEGIEQVYK